MYEWINFRQDVAKLHPDFQIVSTPENEKIPYWEIIKVRCTTCGEQLEIGAKYLLNSHTTCIACAERVWNETSHPKSSRKVTKESFITKASNYHSDAFDYSKVRFLRTTDPILVKCKKHNQWFTTTIEYHLNHGYGCPQCKREAIATNHKISPSVALKRLNTDVPGYSVVSKIDETVVTMKCSKHNMTFVVSYKNALHHKLRPCPNCHKEAYIISRGEKLLRELLDEARIQYEAEKTFPTLKNDRTGYHLYLDFYLPEKDYVIEYHGIQHYKVQERFGNSITETQRRDKMKEDFCQAHNLKYLCIPYNEVGGTNAPQKEKIRQILIKASILE